LCLSKNLGYHTPSLVGAVTVDVGESCMTFGEGLSPEIEAAVPIAAGRILELVLGVLKM
jgi:Ni,Fe-hydrogenase maturation factor